MIVFVSEGGVEVGGVCCAFWGGGLGDLALSVEDVRINDGLDLGVGLGESLKISTLLYKLENQSQDQNYSF